MKKLLVFICVLLLTPLVAGVYGIFHDQLTYTISPEYYTLFKFYQFGLVHDLNEAILTPKRLLVAKVGFMATWWVGIFIGLIQGLFGFMQKDYKTMIRTVSRAIGITIITTFVTGLIGLGYGYFYLAKTGVNWTLPDGLIDLKSFIMVGSMHNFGYLGAVIGAILGIIYQKISFWEHRDKRGAQSHVVAH